MRRLGITSARGHVNQSRAKEQGLVFTCEVGRAPASFFCKPCQARNIRRLGKAAGQKREAQQKLRKGPRETEKQENTNENQNEWQQHGRSLDKHPKEWGVAAPSAPSGLPSRAAPAWPTLWSPGSTGPSKRRGEKTRVWLKRRGLKPPDPLSWSRRVTCCRNLIIATSLR